MRKRTFMVLVALIAIEPSLFSNGASAPEAPNARSAARREAKVPATAEISRDSLEAMVRFVSVDPETGASRTRYTLRVAPLALVADSLAARLERYTGNPVERLSFEIVRELNSRDSTFVAQNIVARIGGSGAVEGVFLVTAHYDATALRTPGWLDNWQWWPAPGADDNGTGVAAILEAARVLSDYELPFGVFFVLFSGEELGRLGSIDFVRRYESLYGKRIIGVLNCDMLGYPFAGSPAGTVLANPDSGWLADMIGEAARALDPTLPLAVELPGPSNSDHASFWEASIPAVTFIEPLGEHWRISGEYHTLGDTMSWIDFDQVERLTKLMVGFLRNVADAPAEIALYPTDLTLFFRGVPTLSRSFEMGDTIDVRLRVRNRGAENTPKEASVRLVLSVENDRGSHAIFSEMLDHPAALDFRELTLPLVLGPDFVGANKIRAAIFVNGMIDIPDNNAGEVWLGVGGNEESVLMHAVQPNPIGGAVRSASLCINLARAVDMGIELYNLEGERLGSAYVGARWGKPLEPGMNCMKLGELFPNVDRLASGVYLYRLVMYESGAPRRSCVGRFAVEN